MTQLPSPRIVEAGLERRITAGLVAVVAVWLLLLARLFHLQVVEGDRYRVSAQGNSVRTHRMITTRGIIRDRNGEILTDSRASDDVLIVPHETEELELTLQRVAGLAGVPVEPLLERIGRPRGRERFQSLLIARDPPGEAMARIRSRLWALPGVLTQVTPVREYRHEASAAHLLGWLGEISKADLQSRKYQGYRRGDTIGKGGVERLLDADLRGRDGGEHVVIDAHGREREKVGHVEPQPGKNVWLTLDYRLQAVAERGFDATGRNGAVVALDPRSGEVLVLLSRPSFDPNAFSTGIDRDEWGRLVADPGKPLHNRALQGQYPPGSTYKVVTALAGLEKGVIAEDFEVECRGSTRLGRRRYRCWKRGGHGSVDVHRALVESCDVFFYKVGQAVGVEDLAYYARALGLGSPTGIDVGPDAAGLVPTPGWKRRRFGEPWIEGETLSLAIGQGFNLVTPIQLAAAYAAIANGGTRYRPYAVLEVTDPYGAPLRATRPERVERVPVSSESLLVLQRALRGVVHEPHGTGYALRGLEGGIEVAGKTGTAQVVSLRTDRLQDDDIPLAHRDHAWFVAYAPADSPRIVVVVLVEHGGHGGSVAAPIARDIVAEFFAHEQPVGELAAGAGLPPEGESLGD